MGGSDEGKDIQKFEVCVSFRVFHSFLLLAHTHIVFIDVRVVILRAQARVMNIFECLVHEPAKAARVLVGPAARHKLLLRERNLFLVLKKVSTLNSAGGRESPAATAIAVVLDWCNGVGP